MNFSVALAGPFSQPILSSTDGLIFERTAGAPATVSKLGNGPCHHCCKTHRPIHMQSIILRLMAGNCNLYISHVVWRLRCLLTRCPLLNIDVVLQNFLKEDYRFPLRKKLL